MKIDYLIIGQGLAGSLLAWQLIQHKKKVIVVDDGKQNASQIAAGLINPITGMRFVKTANVETLLPAALKLYNELSHFFQQSFYVEKPMLRILRDNKEITACKQRLNDSTYRNYLTGLSSANPPFPNHASILKQTQTGYLLTRPLLAALKKYLTSIDAFQKTQLQNDEIKFSPELQWRQYRPQKIIFCQGHHATHNPWFSWLPFQPVKGEIITALAKRPIPDNILNYGNWFIPLSDYQFRTGATFDRDNLNTRPTEQGKKTLLTTLNQVLPDLAIDTIESQQAGIRATTMDKQPFIGIHPKQAELLIFNGFGAKGSLQIPWYAHRLCEHLLNQQKLPETSNIQRYYPS